MTQLLTFLSTGLLFAALAFILSSSTSTVHAQPGVCTCPCPTPRPPPWCNVKIPPPDCPQRMRLRRRGAPSGVEAVLYADNRLGLGKEADARDDGQKEEEEEQECTKTVMVTQRVVETKTKTETERVTVTVSGGRWW